MKIEQKFISLIVNKEKKYEFRNRDDLEGIYKIYDNFYQLIFIMSENCIDIIQHYYGDKKMYLINDRVVTKQ